VQTPDPQSGHQSTPSLRLINTDGRVLSTHNIQNQFSDIDPAITGLQSCDPRMLIAMMTSTRNACRSTGLIPRDTSELIHIGRTLGISQNNTRKIIELVQSGDVRQLSQISIGDLQEKKTRIDTRVLIVLGIWSLTIAIAMSVV
jgi:hypothetical protein